MRITAGLSDCSRGEQEVFAPCLFLTLPTPALPPAPVVPEPGSLVSMALGSLGLAGLMLRARKRQTRQTA